MWNYIMLRERNRNNSMNILVETDRLIIAEMTMDMAMDVHKNSLDEDTPVGFLMIGFDVDDYWDDAPEIARGNYNLWRLMIDKAYQGKGYGKEAVKLALDFINTLPCGKAEYCWLSYEPENWCRYHVVKCCQERGISTCGDCPDYPCDNMKECFEVTRSFEPACRKVCTDEEYESLKTAFFEKEKNLNAKRKMK